MWETTARNVPSTMSQCPSTIQRKMLETAALIVPKYNIAMSRVQYPEFLVVCFEACICLFLDFEARNTMYRSVSCSSESVSASSSPVLSKPELTQILLEFFYTFCSYLIEGKFRFLHGMNDFKTF